MPLARFVVVVVFVLFIAGLAPVRAAMELRCELADRSLALAMVKDGEVFLHDGQKLIPAPSNAIWQLALNLREAVHLFRWSPTYRIERWSGADIHARSHEHKSVWIRLEHRAVIDTDGKPSRSQLLRTWPAGTSSNSLFVFVWVVDGAITHIGLELPADTDATNLFRVRTRFELTPAEAAEGHPGIALWRDGEFVAPAPPFSTPADQDALAAIVIDDAEAMRAALAGGARPDRRDPRSGASLTHIAAEAGSAQTLAVLLQHNRKLARMPTDDKATPLHWAAAVGRVATAQLLLDAGASGNVVNDDGGTPLLSAASAGHLDVVRQLLDARASPKIENKRHRTPLSLAIDWGYADIAGTLFEAGARFTKNDDIGRVLLTQARRGHTAMVAWLIAHGVDPKGDWRGDNALHAAAITGDPELATLLIKHGVALDHPNADGTTPLMAGIKYRRADFTAHLLAAGADIHARNEQRLTALHLAAIYDQPAAITLLLDHGARETVATSGVPSPLELALEADSVAAIKVFVERGARLDASQATFSSALEAAIRLDIAPLIERAMADGWSPVAAVQAGWFPIEIAEMFKSSEVLAVLAAAGATVRREDAFPIVRATELDAPPRVVTAIAPHDPREVFDGFPAQTVEVDVLINADGRVLFPRIKESPDARLRATVLASLSQWRFAPLTRGGLPVATRVSLPLRFASSSERSFASSQIDVAPRKISGNSPTFPRRALNNHEQASLTLRFVVNREGEPEDIRVVGTSGEAFATAAVKALQTWRYQPGLLDGQPVAVEIEQGWVFTLID